MINKELFKIALKYIEKGYSNEDLRWGDDLYGSSFEEKQECSEYYKEIKDEGINWAYKQLKDDN